MGICPEVQSDLRIENISSRLTGKERLLRDAMMDAIILAAAPLKATGATMFSDAQSIFSALEAKNVFGRDINGDVACVYPVSAYPTRHKVNLKNGRTFHAMCAIDSLGCAFTFRQDTRIDSSCSYCAKQIAVTIENERLSEFQPPGLCILRYDRNTVASINANR